MAPSLSPEPDPEQAVIDGSDQVTCENVEVIKRGDLAVLVRIGVRVVMVPPLRMLPGTTVSQTGDRGRLVLPGDVARSLGLTGSRSE